MAKISYESRSPDHEDHRTNRTAAPAVRCAESDRLWRLPQKPKAASRAACSYRTGTRPCRFRGRSLQIGDRIPDRCIRRSASPLNGKMFSPGLTLLTHSPPRKHAVALATSATNYVQSVFSFSTRKLRTGLHGPQTPWTFARTIHRQPFRLLSIIWSCGALT